MPGIDGVEPRRQQLYDCRQIRTATSVKKQNKKLTHLYNSLYNSILVFMVQILFHYNSTLFGGAVVTVRSMRLSREYTQPIEALT